MVKFTTLRNLARMTPQYTAFRVVHSLLLGVTVLTVVLRLSGVIGESVSWLKVLTPLWIDAAG